MMTDPSMKRLHEYNLRADRLDLREQRDEAREALADIRAYLDEVGDEIAEEHSDAIRQIISDCGI